jgi:hypothetical protein
LQFYIRTKRFAPNVWCANVWHDASSHAMSSFWDDSDSDSSSGDHDPTLRQRRDKWRRLADNIRAEADPWQSGCGVPAGPRMRKKRAHELPGTRDKRFSHDFSWRDESVPGVLTTLRARGGASSGTRMCMTRQVLQAGDSGASFACPGGCGCLVVLEASKQPKWGDKPPGPGHGRGPARAVHPCYSRSWRLCRTLARGVTWWTLKTWHISRCPP